ncbi:WAS/WASL-interacting protein family member 1-like [Gorilla gorilla gorilla]|uniref:WAS/WASL-interacting protein family member 1-like n=1 Tax=Gorilla gorilla gorilla TaxID=9595 RepID=UPI00123EBDA5|nr:WAS/WASL-interacting protein family member 1-like [Gorilla gorilla gorilla]
MEWGASGGQSGEGKSGPRDRVKGEKRGYEERGSRALGSWGDDGETGRAAWAELRGWNPDAGRGRGRRDGGWGPPGGAGDHQTLQRASLLPGGSADKDQEREPSLAARGTSPPAPPRQCLPTPCPPLGHGLRPRPPPGTPPPRCPRTLAPGPRGLFPAPPPAPARTGPAGKAAADRGRPGPAAGRRVRRSPSFPPFLLAQTRLGRTGPLALCLLLLLHGAMRLGGGSREKLACGRAGRAARTGRGEGGRRAEEEAAGRRRRRPGRTRGIPRAAGGLSRAGTRVLRYPSSHRRQ